MNAKDDYEETTRKINEALNTSMKASKAVSESIERVSHRNKSNYVVHTGQIALSVSELFFLVIH